MAATRWSQLAIGPTIRRERDSRVYAGLFDREPWAVGEGSLCIRSRRAVPEPIDLQVELGVGPSTKDEVIVFRGLSDYFDRLIPHQTLIAHSLGDVSRSLLSTETMPVVAHVRRGDFPETLRTPDQWFLDVSRSLRSFGFVGPIALVSDGTADELRPLLEEGFVLQRGGTALQDLWTLARSSVLIASGASTFSSWGAFLGSALTIAPLDQDITGLDRWLPDRVHRVQDVGSDLANGIRVRLNI